MLNTTKPFLLLAAGLCVAVIGTVGYLVTDSDAPQSRPVSTAATVPSGSAPWRAGAQLDRSPFARGAPVDAPNTAFADVPRQAQPVYGRNGRPLDFGGKTALQFIAQTSAAARSGNLDAAYQTYHAEAVCATNDEPIPEFQDAAERSDFLRERESLKTLCAGVSPAQVQERLHYLATAARGGKTDAQIDFYMEGPNGKTGALRAGRDDPQVQQWKEDAVGYLKSAASQGEPFALGLLAQAYSVGELMPHDPKLALMYTVAEATARNTVLSPTQLQRHYGSTMSPAEFQAAVQSGTQLGQDCCKK